MSDRKLTAVIVDDDADVASLLVEVLSAAGFETFHADNGVDGVRAVQQHRPQLVTLDVNLPGIDGFEVARRIRAVSDTFIIMITGREDEGDAVLGLTAGADDYLVKPFRPRELRARIDSMLRRLRTGQTSPEISHGEAERELRPVMLSGPPVATPFEAAPAPRTRFVHHDLALDTASRVVTVAGREVELSRSEFDLLAALMQSQRRVRSKSDLALVLREESNPSAYYAGVADRQVVEAHMTNLRRKLGDSPVTPRYIETVRGVGYRLTS